MKKMTCKQLGGACDVVFFGETFEEMVSQSKKHGMEMFQKADEAHVEAMQKMQTLLKSPSDFEKWLTGKKAEFMDLSND